MGNIRMDLNETIVDFSAASYKFEQHFGDKKALSKWFDKVEKTYKEDPSQVFETVAVEAIEKLAKEEQKFIINDEKEAMVNLIFQLPDHKNACEKIKNLKNKGVDLVFVLDKAEKRMSFKEISQCF